MKLQIDSIDLSQPAFSPIVEMIAQSVKQAQEVVSKREELPRYMTKRQASEYCGVSFNTFQKFIKAGLPIVSVDGVVRVDKNDVDAFFEQNKK